MAQNDKELKRVAHQKHFLPSTSYGQKPWLIADNQHLCLQYRNIGYEAVREDSGENFSILDDVSGFARPGAILVVMGPSGAGKTSLLNILSRRVQPTQGTLLINNQIVGDEQFKSVTAYVPQDDILLGSLTAHEVLSFTAELLLPETMSAEEKAELVEETLFSLGLAKSAHTPIGYVGNGSSHSGFKRGLSGGERKRVSIAVELLTNPRIMILDEPTSGLDSSSAKTVMKGLKKMANEGRTIITTIHQPSIDIFRMFDDIVILSDGKTVYFGPCVNSLSYFAKRGCDCPPHYNPGSFFLKILYTTLDTGSTTYSIIRPSTTVVDYDEENDLASFDKTQGIRLVVEWAASEESVNALNDYPSETELNIPAPENRASFFKQFKEVFKRSLKNVRREPLLTRARIGQNLFLSLVAGLIYYDIGRDQVGLRDRTSALFFVALGQTFSNVAGPMFLFPAERAVFKRESASGMYSTLSYFLGRWLSDIPMNVLAPLVFSSIIYGWISSLVSIFCDYQQMSTSLSLQLFRYLCKPWIAFYVIVMLLATASASLGILLGVWVKSYSLLFIVQPAILFPMVLYSGYYVNLDTIPDALRWLHTISYSKFAFRALATNELVDQSFYCTRDQLVMVRPGCGSSMMNNGTLICPIEDGSTVLEQLSLDGFRVYQDAFFIFCFIIIFQILSFVGLRRSRKFDDA